MREEAKRWWDAALRKLDAALDTFAAGHYEEASFWAHQAAELGLKACHLERFRSLQRVHDLTHLAKRLAAPSAVLRCCETLTPVYVETRYPDSIPASHDVFTEDRAKGHLACTQKVIRWIKQQLSSSKS